MSKLNAGFGCGFSTAIKPSYVIEAMIWSCFPWWTMLTVNSFRLYKLNTILLMQRGLLSQLSLFFYFSAELSWSFTSIEDLPHNFISGSMLSSTAIMSAKLPIYCVIVLISICVCFAENNCTPGYYLSNSSPECVPCPAGTYQPNSGAEGCISCEDGYVSTSDGSTSCRACEPTKTSNEYHTACECPIGYEFLFYSTGDCRICSTGTYYLKEDGYTYCNACPANTYQPNMGQTECLDCPEGSYSGYRSNECFTCPEGQAVIDRTCSTCPEGSYYDANAATCTECLPGTFQPLSGLVSSCETCPEGSFSGFGYASCVPCKKGTALMSDGTCGYCDAGEYYDMYSLSCDPCYPGSYTPNKQVLNSCYNCGLDAFSLRGSKKCTSCKEGKTLLSTGKCGTCPPGTYLDVNNDRKCVECPANSFSSGGILERCADCPDNLYSLPGSSSCTSCPENQALLTETGQCGTCIPGYFFDYYTGSCMQCYGGQYKPTEGLQQCQDCPGGSFPSDDYTACLTN